MKIIVIEGNTASNGNLHFRLLADSTLLGNNKPFFLPDFAPAFCAKPAIAVRIDRLGKNIAERFAHRYHNHAAACALVIASGTDQSDARFTAFDGAFMLGEFLPVAETLTAQLAIDGNAGETATTSHMRMSIDQLVAQASQYFTLKMGDLLVIASDQAEGTALAIGNRLEVALNGSESLKARIR